jgi:toxin ParE1/3/4
MAGINWTTESEKCLTEIYDYIAARNPAAAYRTIEGIFQKTQILEAFPQIGYRYEEIRDREIRILLYGHYRIVYLLRDSQQSIDILGVFHGSMDIETRLDSD